MKAVRLVLLLFKLLRIYGIGFILQVDFIFFVCVIMSGDPTVELTLFSVLLSGHCGYYHLWKVTAAMFSPAHTALQSPIHSNLSLFCGLLSALVKPPNKMQKNASSLLICIH